MRRLLSPLVLALLCLSSELALAQPPGQGEVAGTVRDRSTNGPLEQASVVLVNKADPSLVRRTPTDARGTFTFSNLPWGTYTLECSFIGHGSFRSPDFTLSEAHRRLDLQAIALAPSAFALDEVVISSEKNLFNHAIDRKVYNIDQDIMAKSSTVGELLQNIPSVQVDLDGNVSLRGSTDVMILINGKPSPLMGKSRADVLQQLPAGTVEKIEVITNPSARFTPEGTSGIINIVMKKGAATGTSGSVTGRVGTAGRYSESLEFNCNPGKVNLFGSYSHRDDRRVRTGTDARWLAASSGPERTYREDSRITMRPHVHMANLGVNYQAGPSNRLELTGDYFRRRPERHGLSTIVSRADNDSVLRDFDRRETGYESESEAGVTAAFQHDFPKKDHELRVEANASTSPETESTHFAEVYRTPAGEGRQSSVLLKQDEKQGNLSIDYVNPISDTSKLEAGYALELTGQDIRSDGQYLDPAGQAFVPDAARIYRFRLDQTIHAMYGTYEHSFGRINALGGLRAEYATVKPDLVTSGVLITNRYSGFYPTLHLAYELAEKRQLQLNYSRRINRPESEDLNPFPEYADAYNVEAGNAHLRPETIHSVELGYQWRGERFSFVPSIYYRYKRDGFTRVTQAINDSTLLRTMMNLASDQSAGLEPVLTASLGGVLTLNLNGNVFYDQIDASNIGYTSHKSVVSWSGTFNVDASPVKTTVFQVNSNYRSARLTPQGDSRPSFVLNLGMRQELFRKRLSITVAVSDLLKTQRQEMRLDIAGTRQHVTNRRDSRIVSLGMTYHYGGIEKKEKGKSIQYEEQQ